MPTLVNVLHIFPEDNASLRDAFIRLVSSDGRQVTDPRTVI